MPNQGGDLNDKDLALRKSCAGHIGKVHNEIVQLMENCASPGDVSWKRFKFDKLWRKFVDAQERYLEHDYWILLRTPLFWKRHRRSTTNS